jgi:hypothetical protein
MFAVAGTFTGLPTTVPVAWNDAVLPLITSPVKDFAVNLTSPVVLSQTTMIEPVITPRRLRCNVPGKPNSAHCTGTPTTTGVASKKHLPTQPCPVTFAKSVEGIVDVVVAGSVVEVVEPVVEVVEPVVEVVEAVVDVEDSVVDVDVDDVVVDVDVELVVVVADGATLKLSSIDGAGLNVASPPWSAWTVQVPTPTNVMISPLRPLDVHTKGVVVENDTGSPESAVATAVTGEASNVVSGNAGNVMV